MRKSYILSLLAGVLMIAIPVELFAAYTMAIFPTSSPTDAKYFTFENAGTNVPDEMVAYASVTGDWNDYSYWIGVDNQQVPGISVSKELNTLGTSATGLFSVNIYTSHTYDENYYPHQFRQLDDTQFIYGVACWVATLTDGCTAGDPNTAGSHVFTGSNTTFEYEFPVDITYATFKILKSPNGSDWGWDAGQIGHPQSGTVLKAGENVIITDNGAGNISLNLPGLKKGDKVSLNLIKEGAVYELVAYYVPTPVITQIGDGCNKLIFRLDSYDTSEYKQHFTLNGAPITFTGNQYEVPNPIRGQNYTVKGYFTDDDDWAGFEASLTSSLPPLVEKPIVTATSSVCNVPNTFTLMNQSADVNYVWKLNGVSVTPQGDKYTLVSPISGTEYKMEVTAFDGCSEQTSDAVSRVYKESPEVPLLKSQFSCGTAPSFTVTNYSPANTYSWFVNGGLVTASGDTYTVEDGKLENKKEYVTKVSASKDGCESPVAEIINAYIKIPDKPDIAINSGCGNPVVFTLVSTDSYSSYSWTLNGKSVSPSGNSYTVQNPEDGLTYTMNVIASTSTDDGMFGPCVSSVETKSQTYQITPSAPIVTPYVACATVGTGSWGSLVQKDAGMSLVWYESQVTVDEIPEPAGFDMSVAGTKSYWVAQKSASGCYSARVEVKVSVIGLPKAPVVTPYESCPTAISETQEWASLVNATGTLKWYVTETSTVPTQVADFDKSKTQESSYWVSQTSTDGCESKRAEVTVTVHQNPQVPVVTNYRDCQIVGYGKWADLVSATGELRWYDTETSTTQMSTVPDFDMNVVGERSYWVTQLSDKGCESKRVKVSVNVLSKPTVYAGADQKICSGSIATLGEDITPAEDILYSWEPSSLVENPSVPNPVTRPLSATTQFTVTAYNKYMSSCLATSSVTVTVVDKPVAELVKGIVPICEGGSASFENTINESDVSYSWSPAAFIQGSAISYKIITKPLTDETKFTLVASRKLSATETCDSQAEATATIVPSPVAYAGDDASVCYGNTHKLGTASEFGVDYVWTPADKVDNPTSSSPYTVPVEEDLNFTLTATLHDAPYCSSTDVVKITKVEYPKQYEVTGDNNYCKGHSTDAMIVTLSSSDLNAEYALLKNGVQVGDYTPGTGAKMQWYDNTAGVYTIKGRIKGTECEIDMLGSATIIEREAPNAKINIMGTVACPGQEVVVQVVFKGEAPFDFVISENGVSRNEHTDTNTFEYVLTPMSTTIIKIERITDTYCTNYFTTGDKPELDLELESVSDFKIHSSQPHNAICPGESVTLSIDYAGGTAIYKWSTGAMNVPSITVQPFTTTKYSLYAETETGCVIEDSVTVKVVSEEPIVISGLKESMNYCNSEEAIVSATPEGGMFSTVPTEVLQGTNRLDFSKVKTTSTVELKYTYGLEHCSFDTTVVLYVSAVLNEVDWMVVPEFGPPYQPSYSYCLPNVDDQDKMLHLQGYPQQKNGQWEVRAEEPAAVAKITITDPNRAQADFSDYSAGTYWVTYHITDEFGCDARKTKQISVKVDNQELVDMKGFYYDPQQTLCSKSESAEIRADNVSGVFSMSPASSIITQHDGRVWFKPNMYEQGSHQAIYTIMDEKGCPHRYSAPFSIKAPVNIKPFGLKPSYCDYDEDVPLTIESDTPTEGIVNIYKCKNGTSCEDDADWELVEAVAPSTTPVYFRPTWGAGHYKIVYDYQDGVCDWSYSETTDVYAPTPVDMNLKSDYCRSVTPIKLAATPFGGHYWTDAPEGSLINTTFYTDKAGLGVYKIGYEVKNEYGCVSSDSTQIQVRGTDNLAIFDLEPVYCSPEGEVTIFGFPTEEGEGWFTGPSFLTIDPVREGYATMDLTKGDFHTSYNVTYHYQIEYQLKTGETEQCESTLTNQFRILNEASDFGGYEHLSYICGDRDYVILQANHKDNTDFIFSETDSPAFADNHDGTAVIYPKQLDKGMYSVTMKHYLVEDGDTICGTSKSKSFYIERLLDIPQIGLYCRDGNNAIKMAKSEVGVKYSLSVNNNFFEERIGTGDSLQFKALDGPYDIALCKIEASDHGCRYAMSKVISVEKLKMEYETRNITCNGLSNGQFVATVTGGRFPYDHQLTQTTGGSISVKDSLDMNLNVGEYHYSVTDSVGCERTADFEITQPQLLTVTIQKQEVNCTGTSTGMLRAVPQGGTGTPTYQWIDLNTGTVVGVDATLIDVPSGTYQVTVTDVNGCTAFATETLVNPEPLKAVVTRVKNVDVIGTEEGEIDIAVQGGMLPYSYHWSGRSITPATEGLQNQTDLLAGNYFATVTDNRGCTYDVSAVVTEPTPFIVTDKIKNVSCNGGSDAYVNLTVTGATAPYSYLWTHPDATTTTDKDVLNVKAGIYHVVITDAVGNVYENDYKVTEPQALTVETIITSNFEEKCFGDATANIDIAINGGTEPFSVNWIGVTPEQIADSAHIFNLVAGSYQVKIVDAKACETSLSQNITQPSKPLAITDVHITENVCSGEAAGSIEIVVEGGTAPYTYRWSGVGVVEDQQNQYNLNGGLFGVNVTDANGCTIDRTFTLFDPAPISITAFGENLKCFESDNGKVWSEVNGGVYPYSFVWTFDGTQISTDSIVSSLNKAGSYYVELTDKLGCKGNSVYEITQPSELTATTGVYNITCNGANDGKVTVTPQGGVEAYNYAWYNVADMSTVISSLSEAGNLTPGAYRAQVTDANGCTLQTAVLTVAQPDALTITYVKDDVAVYGEATGQIALTVTGGSPSYTYLWTSGPSITDVNKHDATIVNLLAGDYFVEVTDVNGCVASEHIKIAEPNILEVTETIGNVVCNGTNTGNVNLTVSGGLTPYTFVWTSDKGYSATTKDILNLVADKYTVIVTDAGGATVTRTYEVTEPDALTAEIDPAASITSVKCFGDKSGAIKMIYSGGTMPYSVVWNGPDAPAVLSDITYLNNIGVGTYSLTLTDASGCVNNTFNTTITGPAAPLSIDGVITNTKCAEDRDGAITLNVTGGTAPYTFKWTGDEGLIPDAQNQTTLVPGGTYRVEVTDANGCVESKVFTLETRTEMLISLTSQDEPCYGDSKGIIEASVTGGTGVYVPEWVNSDGSWKSSNYKEESLLADVYTFTIKDDAGCEKSGSVTILEPNELTVKAEAPSVLCDGISDGDAYANIPEGAGTKPYTYTWYNDSGAEIGHGSHLAHLGAGYYTLGVVDANGCQASDNFLINASSLIVIDVVSVHNVSVHGGNDGSIDVNVTGGTPPLSYSWTGRGIDPTKQGNLNQSNLVAGTYTLTVKDQFECTNSVVVTITEPATMVVTPVVKQLTCDGDKGYIELSVTGGDEPYLCSWTSVKGFTSDQLLIYDLEPDIYSVEITDQRGNKFNANYEIYEVLPVEWKLLESSKTELTCYGDRDGFLNLQVTGGSSHYNITWHGPKVSKTGVFNISNLGAGTYTAYIEDSKGCKPLSQFTAEIVQPDTLMLKAEIVNNICYGDKSGSIILDITGGVPDYTYQWSGYGVISDSKNQENLLAGNYSLNMNDRNGCTLDTTFVITSAVEYNASISGQSEVCKGDEIPLLINVEGTAPWNVEYTDGKDIFSKEQTSEVETVTVSPIDNCTYRLLSVKDGNGCQNNVSGQVPVTVNNKPSMTIISTDGDCCLGDAVNVDVFFGNPGPWYVSYSDGSHTYNVGPFTEQQTTIEITPTVEGRTHYTMLNVSNDNCTSEVNYEFDVDTYQYPNLAVDVPPYVCQPNPIEVTLHPTGSSPWVVSYNFNGLHYEEEVLTDGQTIEHTTLRPDNIFVFESIRSGERCITTLGKQLQTTVGMLPLDATLITGPNVVCMNSEYQYHTADIAYADKYEWELPEGFTILSGAGSQNIVVGTDNTAVSGEIKVKGVNDCGEGGISSIYVDVTKPITETGEISAPLYVCENAAMFALSVSEVAGATDYEWTVPTGYLIVSGQGSKSILVEIDIFAKSGNVTVVPKNACMNAEPITKFVTIRPLPIAEAGIDFNTNCATDAKLNAKLDALATAKWTLMSGGASIKDATSPTTEISDIAFGVNEFRWDVTDGYCLNFDTVAVTCDNPGITEPEETDIVTCESQVLLRAPEPKYGSGKWTLIFGDGEVLTPDSNESYVVDLSTKVTNVVRWEVYHGACSNTRDVNIISNSLSKLADAGEDGVTLDGTYRLSARMIGVPEVQGTWEVVNGGTGTIDNPHSENTVVRGLQPGISTVRWTLRGYDCEAYDEIQIRSVDEPEASYKVDEDAGCVPFTVFFNNTTLGEATYKWDFGDGFSSEIRSPEHTYTKAGTYMVTLVATGKRKTDQYQGKITVYPSPKADFISGERQLYIPKAVIHFTNNTDKTTAWWWDFGDGRTSVEENPLHQYFEDGLYTVTFAVTDEKGCKDTLVVKDYVNVSKESFIVFPSAFVPKIVDVSDGIFSPEERRLDIFYPVFRNVDTYTLKVYNQWGTQVFQSDEILKGWNGWYKGQCAAQGTYVYKAEGTFKDGTSFRTSGNITLVR